MVTNFLSNSGDPSVPFDKGRFLRTAVLTAIPGCCFVFLLGATGVRTWDSSRLMVIPLTNALHDPRVVILKSDRVLHLFEGPTLVRSYPVDLGAQPFGQKLHDGDARTPLGTFRIISKNPDSPHSRFLGLNYPHREAVLRGWWRGLISHGEALSLLNALASGGCPDWSTALGGGIGIHGGGKGLDWTGGCIALSDAHIKELFDVLRVGDPVEILP